MQGTFWGGDTRSPREGRSAIPETSCSGSLECSGSGASRLRHLRMLGVTPVREPDAGKPHVRFDEEGRETRDGPLGEWTPDPKGRKRWGAAGPVHERARPSLYPSGTPVNDSARLTSLCFRPAVGWVPLFPCPPESNTEIARLGSAPGTEARGWACKDCPFRSRCWALGGRRICAASGGSSSR
jgi:hypothetical protein